MSLSGISNDTLWGDDLQKGGLKVLNAEDYVKSNCRLVTPAGAVHVLFILSVHHNTSGQS
jgi:hypothetical protein